MYHAKVDLVLMQWIFFKILIPYNYEVLMISDDSYVTSL